MEKRRIEKLGVDVSLLGFGCMRFPKNEDGTINEELSEKMIDYAIEHGVNYIDTAYPYHNGDSEPFVGKVLNKYPRDSYYLTTKLPIWNVNSKEEAVAMFYKQLERLDKEYVDFYLLHALDKTKWQKVLDLGILEAMEELQKEGKIRYLGFSFHDTYEVFEQIMKYKDWDFAQIQYNYMDTVIQAGDKGYALSKELNIPLMIMEPIKGGSLVRLPEDITNVFKEYNSDYSLASWALRWVATHSNVKVVLSGMSDFEQVKDNIATFENFRPLNDEEKAVVDKVYSIITSRQKNGCTACGYCMPCPFGLNIPKNFQYWNEASVFNNPNRLKNGYEYLKEGAAEFCKQCGLCEKMCPQQISIREDLKKIAAEYKNL